MVDENLLPKRGNNDEIIIRPGDKFLFTDTDERTRRILAVALFQKAAEQDYELEKEKELDIRRHRVRQFQVGMNDILFNKQPSSVLTLTQAILLPAPTFRQSHSNMAMILSNGALCVGVILKKSNTDVDEKFLNI